MQQSTNALIESLQKKGHQAAVLCALMPNGFIGKMGRLKIKLSKTKFSKDMARGYPVYRAWFPWQVVANVVKCERPDVIVVLTRMSVKMALAARSTGIPFMMMLQDVEFDAHGGEFQELGDITCVANSAFTAGKYHDAFGVNPHVIHPLIFPEKYKTDTTRECVVYINPNPTKGLILALAVAKACPDILFLFQEAWPLTPEQFSDLNGQIVNLPNVTIQRSVADMRQVYNRAKIILAPSKWEEAYGRVATEAHISGIPVVASNRGGLPEAVGNGGVLLDPEGDIQDWVNVIRKLWSDHDYYQTKVDAAYAEAKLPQHDIENQVDMWEKLLMDVIASKGNIKP